MIARSFRPVGWVAAVGVAALGCYMLSLRVASERADLDRLNSRIVAASQNIRSLQTELGTRGRMQQLEAWNEEVLALSAPVSGQFVEGSVSLARFDTRQPPSAVEAPVQLASAPAPTPATTPAPRPAVATPRQAVAAPAPAQSLVRQASAVIPPVTPAPATTATTTVRRAAPPTATAERRPAPTEAAPIRTASRETAPARTATPPVKRAPATTTETRTAAVTPPARSRAGLLDDRTIRALGSASRSERGGGTRD